MSENVERLRWLYGEWAKGNLWALRDIADPDIEWQWAESLSTVYGGPRIYRGLEEIGAATLDWLAAWDSYWMTAEDFIDAGDEVVVFMHVHARAGIPTPCSRNAWPLYGPCTTGEPYGCATTRTG